MIVEHLSREKGEVGIWFDKKTVLSLVASQHPARDPIAKGMFSGFSVHYTVRVRRCRVESTASASPGLALGAAVPLSYAAVSPPSTRIVSSSRRHKLCHCAAAVDTIATKLRKIAPLFPRLRLLT